MTAKGPILITTDNLGGGGSERAVVTVANGLARLEAGERVGPSIELLLFSSTGPFLGELESQVLVTELPRRGGWVRRNRERVMVLREILRRRKPRAVLSFLSHVNLVTLAAARGMPGLRVIVVEQNILGSDLPGRGISREVLLAAQARLYRGADRVVAISEGVARQVRDRLGVAGDRLRVIPNPVDLDRVNAFSAAESSSGPFRFVFCGRIEPQKNVPLLLEAFALARQRHSGLELEILGEGTQWQLCRDRAEQLGIAHAVHWRGFLPEPWAVMARGGALVLSSNHEGFGNVIVEALALGLPVVSTDCPHGPSEILGSDPRLGRLVRVGNAESLAEAMVACATDPDRRKPDAIAARRERARDYDAPRIVEAYARIVEGS